MCASTDFEHFRRYLHYGMDSPLYIPGDRFYLKCYTKEKCAFLNKIIETSPPEEIIGQIVKVCLTVLYNFHCCVHVMLLIIVIIHE